MTGAGRLPGSSGGCEPTEVLLEVPITTEIKTLRADADEAAFFAFGEGLAFMPRPRPSRAWAREQYAAALAAYEEAQRLHEEAQREEWRRGGEELVRMTAHLAPAS